MSALGRARVEHRITVTVYGDHVEVLDAVALADDRTASEVAAELLGRALDASRQDPDIQQLLRARRRRARRGTLQAVPGGPGGTGPAAPTVPASAGSRGEVVAIEAVASFDPDALFALRRAKGLSHDGLAQLVGIARPNLIAYEKGGKRPSPRTLRSLAAALGVDPMKLVTVTTRTATLADLRAVKGGLTTTETAAALGVPRHSYDRIEAGRRPLDDATAERLAEIFGVSRATLVAAHERGRGPRP